MRLVGTATVSLGSGLISSHSVAYDDTANLVAIDRFSPSGGVRGPRRGAEGGRCRGAGEEIGWIGRAIGTPSAHL